MGGRSDSIAWNYSIQIRFVEEYSDCLCVLWKLLKKEIDGFEYMYLFDNEKLVDIVNSRMSSANFMLVNAQI